MSKTSQLYIMRYPDENPVLYKIGSSSHPNQRINELKKPSRDKPNFNGYQGRIELFAVYFISNARLAEGKLSRFLKEYRIEKEYAKKTFGTFEVYLFDDDLVSRVHNVIVSMFLGLA